MRTLRAAAAAALVVLAAVHAQGDGSLEGRPAPEIETTVWLGGDGRTTLADFRGQVVLLEFWKTSCGASRSEIRHLVRLAEDLGKKGLEIVALTGEDDRRTLERFLAHVDASPGCRVAIGRAPGYAVKRLPCAVLVGADGNVLVDGTAGRSISSRDVEAALKAAKPPGAGEAEPRAAKRLAFAASFADARLFARAERELRETARLFPGTAAARDAAERLEALAADTGAAAELAAQKEVAKLAGLDASFERPAARLKPSDAEARAKRLAKKADDLRAKTPAAAEMAAHWAGVLAEGWR